MKMDGLWQSGKSDGCLYVALIFGPVPHPGSRQNRFCGWIEQKVASNAINEACSFMGRRCVIESLTR